MPIPVAGLLAASLGCGFSVVCCSLVYEGTNENVDIDANENAWSTVHGYRFLQYPTWDPDRTTTWTLHKLIYARYHGVVASEEARLQNSRE